MESIDEVVPATTTDQVAEEVADNRTHTGGKTAKPKVTMTVGGEHTDADTEYAAGDNQADEGNPFAAGNRCNEKIIAWVVNHRH